MTDYNSMLNGFKDSFAPVSDALKNFQNIEVPEAARDFMKRTTATVKKSTAEIHSGAETVTGAIETVVVGSVSQAVKLSHSIQQAIYEDAEAFFSSMDKLASAKSLNEAVQIQADLIRSRSEVAMDRAKSASGYVGKLLAESAKTAQDNLSKVVNIKRTLA